ncbi:MFS family permease [Pseudoclavibacter chungangensis]|uniref:MFS transporter n=1 Tax=Pseudoclavibacter chungangensis TaxID=587635 RepID=UPI0015CC8315|nr:MFS transporter [Pseudoclavibacter chungangensis]NYJ68582.1 MFS family permease [Pseudoclavibacter chungangensis]
MHPSRAALLACLGAGFATLLDASVIAFTAPAVRDSLGLDTGQVQWFLASFSLTFGLGLAPAGRLGDAYGRRTLFTIGLLVFVTGAIVSGLAFDGAVLVGGRLLQGFGAGVISAQVLGVMQDVFTGQDRLRALAAYTSAGAAAGIVGPLLAGGLFALLDPALAWRLVLLAPAPFAVVTIVLALRGLPRDGGRRARVSLDLPGIALLGALVVVVTIPVIDPGIPPAGAVAIVVASVLLLVALVVWERATTARGRLALFAPALIRSRGFVLGNVAALLWFGSVLATGTVTAVHFLDSHGIGALTVALALVPAAAGRIVASQQGARLFARSGPIVVPIGLAVHATCIATMWLATFLVDGVALFVTVCLVQIPAGMASGIVEPALRAVTLGHAPPGFNGVAASFLQLTQRLSATFFVALTTGILLAGAASPTAALGWALLVCALAAACAALTATDRSVRGAPGR